MRSWDIVSTKNVKRLFISVFAFFKFNEFGFLFQSFIFFSDSFHFFVQFVIFRRSFSVTRWRRTWRRWRIWRRRRFFRTDPLSYHKFENMVIFRQGNLYTLCSPGNQDYQKIIHFYLFFIKKGRNRQCKNRFIGISWRNIFLIIELWSLILTFFDEKIKKWIIFW